MSEDRFNELMMLFLEDALSQEDAREFMDLLDDNPECRERLNSELDIVNSLKLEFAGSNDEFADGVMTDIDSLPVEISSDRTSPRKCIKFSNTSARSTKPLRSGSKIWKYVSFAAAAGIAIVAGILFINNQKETRASLSPVVGTLQGNAEMEFNGQKTSVADGKVLAPGTSLHLDKGSVMSMRYSDGTSITLTGASVFSVVDTMSAGKNKILKLEKGYLDATVVRQKTGYPFVVDTDFARMAVVGTRFIIRKEESVTVKVIDGKVKVTSYSDNNSIELTNGKKIQIDKSGIVAPGRKSQKTVRNKSGISIAAPKLSGLLAYYAFDEGKGNIIHDRSNVGTSLDLRIRKSGATEWIPGGGLDFIAPSAAVSNTPALKIISACKKSRELTVEVWIKSSNINPMTREIGMSRILTISKSPTTRNFTLGQGGIDNPPACLGIRIRTDKNDRDTLNGLPLMTTPVLQEIRKKELMHVLFRRNANGDSSIWVNGLQVAAAQYADSLKAWDKTQKIAIGAEFGQSFTGGRKRMRLSVDQDIRRAWLGHFYFAALYSRALTDKEIQDRFKAKK